MLIKTSVSVYRERATQVLDLVTSFFSVLTQIVASNQVKHQLMSFIINAIVNFNHYLNGLNQVTTIVKGL